MSVEAYEAYRHARGSRNYQEALSSFDRYALLTTYKGPDGDRRRERDAELRLGLLIMLGRTNEAMAACEVILSKDPDNTSVRAKKAAVFRQMGDLSSALLEYDTILKTTPRSISTWIDKAACTAALERSEREAIRVLTHALEVNQTDRDPGQIDYFTSELLCERALYRVSVHDWAGAYEDLHTAAQQQPIDDSDARVLYARAALVQGELEIGAALVRQLTTDFPDDPFVAGLRGNVLLLQGDPAEAVPELEIALERDESLTFVKELLYHAHSDLGNEELAWDYLEETLAASESASAERDPYDDVRRILQKCDAEPDNAELTLRLAETFSDPRWRVTLVTEAHENSEDFRRALSRLAKHLHLIDADITGPLTVASWCLFPEAGNLILAAEKSADRTTRGLATLARAGRTVRQVSVCLALQHSPVLGDLDEWEIVEWSLTPASIKHLKELNPRTLRESSLQLLETCIQEYDEVDTLYAGTTVGEQAREKLPYETYFGLLQRLPVLVEELVEQCGFSTDHALEGITVVHLESASSYDDDTALPFFKALADADSLRDCSVISITARNKQFFQSVWKGREPASSIFRTKTGCSMTNGKCSPPRTWAGYR